MSSPRQFARARIIKIVDEMIIELNKIKHHALHMDDISIMAIGKSFCVKFNSLVKIYSNLNQRSLPPEKENIPTKQLHLK